MSDRARVPRFHVAGTLAGGGAITLSKEASRHLTGVLRAAPGDALCLFDGDGYDYAAELVEAGRSARVQVRERSVNRCESPLRLTLVQGVSRGDRMDATVRQAVELGVARIVPVRTRRSAVKLDAERAAKRHAHWQGIVISACEQSGRARVPVLEPLADLSDWLGAFDPSSGGGCVLVPGSDTRLLDVPHASGAGLSIVVGPESGLDDGETAAALACGLHDASLGPRVLRTETAGPAALALLQARHGDL